ncbi:type III intermediate filament [Amia ocellicauda]|uniref:type III intermediate filament n=1 Tax=Amia ocellicauda TaxID=2972642 RepID=UPI0034644A98
MLRVSSYRRLFEEEQWSSGCMVQCGAQDRASARAVSADWQLEELDFEVARALSRESLSQCVKERSLIAALNDRLAYLIDTARSLEEENETLEAQILELEGRLSSQAATRSTGRGMEGCSLAAVVEALRKEKEQILSDIRERQKELHLQQQMFEQASEQRCLMQLKREDIAMAVDAVTAECLALRDQVAIYEDQLAWMQEQQEQRIETLGAPGDGVPVVSLEFPCPDVSPTILDIKAYYSQLAQSLQFESKQAAITMGEDEGPGDSRAKAAHIAQVKEIDKLKKRISELQRELAELQRRGEELQGEIEAWDDEHQEEIAQLENCVSELEDSRGVLELEMKQQSDDYEQLLSEKMALDIEITAYRGLVEDEVERLCYL